MYIMLNQFDSAEFHLQNSLLDAQKCHSTKLELKAWNNLAVLYQLQGNYDKSIDCLRNALRQDNLDEEETVKILLNLSNTFLVKGEVDSTALYLRRLEEIDSDGKIKNDTKLSAYGALLRFAEKQGDETAALRYREKHENILYDVMKQRQEQSVYRIQKQYDYEALQNALNRKIANRQRIIVIVGGLLLLLTIALAVSQHRVAVKTKQEAEAKERALFYIQQYYDTLSKEGKTMQKVAVVMENKGDSILLEELSKTVFGKKDPWDAIEEVFFKLHPEKRQNMDRLYPDLTELERRDYILSYFDVSRQDESLLLDISIHTIDKLRQKTKEKTLK